MHARGAKTWFPTAAAALQTLFTRRLTQDEADAVGKDAWPFYAYDYDADPSLATRLTEIAQFDVVRAQQAPQEKFDFRDRLGSLAIPTLIIVGARDFICAPALSTLLHAAMPGSKLVTMEQSGHMPHLEEPAAFASAVVAFLNDSP
jgi:proline iminopeptidase